MRFFHRCLIVFCCLPLVAWAAEIRLRDDTGETLVLKSPATRIVSLAPNITELLFAAGAGAQTVGVVEFSDYPDAARQIPRIGSYARLDIESIVALKPDLVLAWQSGNPASQVEQLRKLGIPVFRVEPKRLEDVPRIVQHYAALAGTERVGDAAANTFRTRLRQLEDAYRGRTPVRLFYQVWDAPLMTVGGSQIINDVIALCGGSNVFAAQTALAPVVSVEAVLAANPEVIVAGGMGERNAAWLEPWKKWPRLAATARGNLFFIDPNLLQRHTPRLLEGVAALCERLDEARRKR